MSGFGGEAEILCPTRALPVLRLFQHYRPTPDKRRGKIPHCSEALTCSAPIHYAATLARGSGCNSID